MSNVLSFPGIPKNSHSNFLHTSLDDVQGALPQHNSQQGLKVSEEGRGLPYSSFRYHLAGTSRVTIENVFSGYPSESQARLPEYTQVDPCLSGEKRGQMPLGLPVWPCCPISAKEVPLPLSLAAHRKQTVLRSAASQLACN